MRSFLAILSDGDDGLYIALSGFALDAEMESHQAHCRLPLVDASKLVELWAHRYGNLDGSA